MFMSDPERLNIQLTPQASTALAELSRDTATNKTVLTNRAVRVYAWLVAQESEGSELIMHSPDGTASSVALIP